MSLVGRPILAAAAFPGGLPRSFLRGSLSGKHNSWNALLRKTPSALGHCRQTSVCYFPLARQFANASRLSSAGYGSIRWSFHCNGQTPGSRHRWSVASTPRGNRKSSGGSPDGWRAKVSPISVACIRRDAQSCSHFGYTESHGAPVAGAVERIHRFSSE
jgi:hypothetical protein